MLSKMTTCESARAPGVEGGLVGSESTEMLGSLRTGNGHVEGDSDITPITLSLIAAGELFRKQRMHVYFPFNFWEGPRLVQQLCHHCAHVEHAIIRVLGFSSPQGHVSRPGLASS